MIRRLAEGIIASLLCVAALCSITRGAAATAQPLPPESRLVATTTAPTTTTSPAVPLAFTIPSAQISSGEELQVTLTDQGIPVAPNSLESAYIVVTQGSTVVGMASLAAPATSASFSFAGAAGDYSLWVFGTPNSTSNVGNFGACVAPKANPSQCIQNASLAGTITSQSTASDPTIGYFAANNLTVTQATAGAYTFNFADLNFPVALNVAPSLALFQGSTTIQTGIPTGTQIMLSPGNYTLLAVAKADSTVQAGVYGITISGPAGTTPLLDTAIGVGPLIGPSSPFNNASSSSVTLKVTDFGFPTPLTSASAMLTHGGAMLGQASTAGSKTFAVPSGSSVALNLWTYGSPGSTPGTYEAEVLDGSTSAYIFGAAQGATPAGSSTYAYGFTTAPVTQGASYQATAADLQFPAQLSGLSFAVAQNSVILQKSTTQAALNITATTTAPVVFLVSAQTPAANSISANGLFDVNLQSTGASPQLRYDKTQSVSSTPALFDARTLTVGTSASFSATLTDLQTPAAFANLALVISHGSDVLGKIYGGGTFSFPGSAGNYQLTFVASPGSQQPSPAQFGMYGVGVVFTPPTITTFTPSASSATINTPITLTWATTDATSCTGSGGGWTVSSPGTSGSQSLVLSATTTYMLSCTGTGGTTSKSVTVTATPAPSSGGGGALDWMFFTLSGSLLLVRFLKRRSHAAATQATR